MPTTVDALDSVPCEIEAGTTIRFSLADSDYPNTTWTAAFVMNDGVHAATSIAGTVSATTSGFDYVIPASTTLYQGAYQWAIYYTAISPTTEKARGETGSVNVIPNLATTATPTHAQSMVSLLESALQALGATTQGSVSFNGQSYSQSSIGEYQSQLVFWQSRVIAEQRKAAALRGENVGAGVETHFSRSREC